MTRKLTPQEQEKLIQDNCEFLRDYAMPLLQLGNFDFVSREKRFKSDDPLQERLSEMEDQYIPSLSLRDVKQTLYERVYFWFRKFTKKVDCSCYRIYAGYL